MHPSDMLAELFKSHAALVTAKTVFAKRNRLFKQYDRITFQIMLIRAVLVSLQICLKTMGHRTDENSGNDKNPITNNSPTPKSTDHNDSIKTANSLFQAGSQPST